MGTPRTKGSRSRFECLIYPTLYPRWKKIIRVHPPHLILSLSLFLFSSRVAAAAAATTARDEDDLFPRPVTPITKSDLLTSTHMVRERYRDEVQYCYSGVIKHCLYWLMRAGSAFKKELETKRLAMRRAGIFIGALEISRFLFSAGPKKV